MSAKTNTLPIAELNLAQINELVEEIIAKHETVPGTNVSVRSLESWRVNSTPLDGLKTIYDICSHSSHDSVKCLGDLAAITHYRMDGTWIL